MACETMKRGDLPSLKRTAPLSAKKPIRRFLYATNGFSLAIQNVKSLDIDTSIFSSIDDLDSLPTLAFGACDPLTKLEVSEREDLHISVKLFVPEKQAGSISDAIRESVKAAKALLNTTQIDSLVIQLPASFDGGDSDEAVITPASPADTIVNKSTSEPRRKSRRLLQKPVLPSPELNPTSDLSIEKDFISSVYQIARSDFGIDKIGVSSSSMASLGRFLNSINLSKTPIDRLVFDSVDGIQTFELGQSIEVLERRAQVLGVPVMVSKDGTNGLAGASFETVVEHVNSTTTEPVCGIAQDWIAKYTVFGVTRSVLMQHGYFIVGSTH